MPILVDKLRTFATVASVLLCAATGVFWVRSYWHQDQLLFPKPGMWGLVLVSERGRVMLRNYGEVDPKTGKGYIVTDQPPWLSFPHYAVVISTAAIPLGLLIRKRTGRAGRRGFPLAASSTERSQGS